MRLGSYWLVPKRIEIIIRKKTKTILKFLYSLDNIARRPKLYSTARVTADDPINNIRVRSRHRRHSRHTKPSHQPTLLLLFF